LFQCNINWGTFVPQPYSVGAKKVSNAKVKALDRDRNALKKKKCFTWIVSIGGDAMAQSRNEICTVTIYWTKFFKGNWKEMIVAGNGYTCLPCVWPPLQLPMLSKQKTC
jgi:hypothetical protein